jgi:hypothetical protein
MAALFSVLLFFLPLSFVLPTIVFPLFLILTTLFPQLFLPLMVGTEVTPAIVIPVIAVHTIFTVAIRADLFDTILADAGGQMAIGDFNPRTVVIS